MHGHNLTDVRYADNKFLLASNIQNLQNLLNRVNERYRNFDMEINIKTKILIICKISSEASDVSIQLDGFFLEHVSSFEYLGSMITSDGRCQRHLTTRVAMAKSAFSDMQGTLCNFNMLFKLRFKRLK